MNLCLKLHRPSSVISHMYLQAKLSCCCKLCRSQCCNLLHFHLSSTVLSHVLLQAMFCNILQPWCTHFWLRRWSAMHHCARHVLQHCCTLPSSPDWCFVTLISISVLVAWVSSGKRLLQSVCLAICFCKLCFVGVANFVAANFRNLLHLHLSMTVLCHVIASDVLPHFSAVVYLQLTLAVINFVSLLQDMCCSTSVPIVCSALRPGTWWYLFRPLSWSSSSWT